MTVTAVRKDPETLTMTLDAEFDASPERVWQLWADPRQLERWWGPPTYPATFTRTTCARQPRRVPHDRARGRPAARLLGRPRGRSAAPARLPRRLRQRRRHAERRPSGNDGRVTIEEIGDGRTRMSIESVFPSVEAMEQVLAMGMEEGLTAGGRPDRRHPRCGCPSSGMTGLPTAPHATSVLDDHGCRASRTAPRNGSALIA